MKKRILSCIICLAMVLSLLIITPTTFAAGQLTSSVVSFTDGTNPITGLTANGTVVASATVSNSGANKNVYLFIAEYQNGEIVQVQADEKTVTSSTPVTLTKSIVMGNSVANSKIKVFVWDENFAPLIYKTELPGANKNLASISIGGVPLSGFSSSVLEYNVSTNNGNTYAVTATAQDSNATVTINQVTMLPGSATVVVTPPNGEAPNTYKINFTQAAAISKLTNVSGATGFTLSSTPFNIDVKLWGDRDWKMNKTNITVDGGTVVADSSITQAGLDLVASGATMISTPVNPTDFITTTVFKPFYTFEINQTAEVKVLSNGAFHAGWIAEGWQEQAIATNGLFKVYNPSKTPPDYHAAWFNYIYTKTFTVEPGKTRVVTLYNRGTNPSFIGYVPVVKFLDNKNVNPNVYSSILKDIKIDNASLTGFDSYTNEYTITVPAGTQPSIVGLPIQSNSRVLYADGPGCKYINVTDGNLTGTPGQSVTAPTGYLFTSTYKVNIKYDTQMANEIKVVAADDTDVRKAYGTTNYDNQASNLVYPNAAMASFALLKFDLSSTIPDTEIQKAELCYYSNTVQYSAQKYYFGQPSNTFNVFPIDPSSWTASTVTFDNMNLTSGTNTVTKTNLSYVTTPANAVGIGGNMLFGATGDSRWYSVDITNYIKDNTGKALSFAVNAPIKNVNDSSSYFSANASATANPNRAYIRIVTKKYTGVDATLSDLKVNGTTITDFASADTAYNYEVANASDNIAVTATPTDPHATVVVKQSKYLPGTATVTVTSSGGTVTQAYTVSFVQQTLPIIDNLITLPAATVAGSATGGIALGTAINGTTPYFWSDRSWKVNNTGYGAKDGSLGAQNTRDHLANLENKTTVSPEGAAFIAEGGTLVKIKVDAGSAYDAQPVNPWYSFDINQTAEIAIVHSATSGLDTIYPTAEGWTKTSYAAGLFQMYVVNTPAVGYNSYHPAWFGKTLYTKTYTVTPGSKATVTLKNQGVYGDKYIVIVKFKAVTQ